MIRDPSDGSVREKSVVGNFPITDDGSDLSRPTTALAPAPKDEKEAARLNKSREWLREYHKPKASE